MKQQKLSTQISPPAPAFQTELTLPRDVNSLYSDKSKWVRRPVIFLYDYGFKHKQFYYLLNDLIRLKGTTSSEVRTLARLCYIVSFILKDFDCDDLSKNGGPARQGFTNRCVYYKDQPFVPALEPRMEEIMARLTDFCTSNFYEKVRNYDPYMSLSDNAMQSLYNWLDRTTYKTSTANIPLVAWDDSFIEALKLMKKIQKSFIKGTITYVKGVVI